VPADPSWRLASIGSSLLYAITNTWLTIESAASSGENINHSQLRLRDPGIQAVGSESLISLVTGKGKAFNSDVRNGQIR